jgi:hypothetical protein
VAEHLSGDRWLVLVIDLETFSLAMEVLFSWSCLFVLTFISLLLLILLMIL